MQEEERTPHSVAANFILWGIGIALFLYSAYQTLQLLQWMLPASEANWAYFALLAFDGGTAGWAYYLKHGTYTVEQRGVAGLITAIDFIGAALCTFIQMVLGASEKGIVRFDPGWDMLIVGGIALVIILNVGAGLQVKLGYSPPSGKFHLSLPPLPWQRHKKAVPKEAPLDDDLRNKIMEVLTELQQSQQQPQIAPPPAANDESIDTPEEDAPKNVPRRPLKKLPKM